MEMITDDDAREFCDTLTRHFAERLSDWEAGFVRSLQSSLRQGRALTDKQRAKLDDIIERCATAYKGGSLCDED